MSVYTLCAGAPDIGEEGGRRGEGRSRCHAQFKTGIHPDQLSRVLLHLPRISKQDYRGISCYDRFTDLELKHLASVTFL